MEEFKSIPGYEGLYEVSNLGNVKSLERYDLRGHKRREKILKPAKAQGYEFVTLSANGEKKAKKVHQLVMLAFVGPVPDGMMVLHGPNGKTDNSLSNLRYGTSSENSLDQTRDGTNVNRNKTKCPRGHELDGLNLNPRQIDQGKRSCYSCFLSMCFMNNRRIKRNQEFTDQEKDVIYADYYQKVMSGFYRKDAS